MHTYDADVTNCVFLYCNDNDDDDDDDDILMLTGKYWCI